MWTPWIIVSVVVAVGMGLWLWRRLLRPKRDEHPASIVLLLRKPKQMDAEALAEIFSRVSGQSVRGIRMNGLLAPSNNDEIAKNMVCGSTPRFAVFLEGTMFQIFNASATYMEDAVQAGNSIQELRTRKAVMEHKAWISMDVLSPRNAEPKHYRIVGRVLAEFIDADCLALYYPPANRFASCNVEETIRKLASDDPIRAVFFDKQQIPVIPIADDPRLAAAEIEARRRFAEFEAAFQAQDGENFSVKTQVSAGENAEHIWVEVERINGGKIQGRLGNDPVELGNLKLGSRVEFEVAQVEDWVFRRLDKPVGLFTVAVVQQIQKEQAKAKSPS